MRATGDIWRCSIDTSVTFALCRKFLHYHYLLVLHRWLRNSPFIKRGIFVAVEFQFLKCFIHSGRTEDRKIHKCINYHKRIKSSCGVAAPFPLSYFFALEDFTKLLKTAFEEGFLDECGDDIVYWKYFDCISFFKVWKVLGCKFRKASGTRNGEEFWFELSPLRFPTGAFESVPSRPSFFLLRSSLRVHRQIDERLQELIYL